mgnify:CR=1 FL=1|jgi:hypothetical protein
MKIKEQVIFDISSDKFRYLHREDRIVKKRVDIDTLNKRLNQVKKINLYTNIKIIALSIIFFSIFALISLNF